MNDARAIDADFASLKWINGRKVLQIICEVPMENTEEVLAVLGTPLPGVGTPVQISPLDIEPDIKKDLARNAEKAKRKFEDLPYSQQAALLCKDYGFQQFMSQKCSLDHKPNPEEHVTESDAINWLRLSLNIKSRSELDDNNNLTARIGFVQIRDKYRAQTGSYPEQRG